jgi:hypothetical protein
VIFSAASLTLSTQTSESVPGAIATGSQLNPESRWAEPIYQVATALCTDLITHRPFDMRFGKLLRFSILALVVVLLWAGQPTALVQAQSDDDVIRVNTDLVVIDAQVLQKKTGRIINSLTREDFQIYEDGVKQEISFFSQDKLPLSVILLFDLTETVRPVLKPLARGALQALQHLKPAG